jgi:hypothetical protein
LTTVFEEGKNMRISCRVWVCAAFCALVAAYAAPARAGLLNFSFSFTNDPSYGKTAGTVTGEIEGLSDNSTGAAADVIIETAPSALGGISTEGPLPIETIASGWNNPIINSFTVSGGQITAASFFAVSSYGHAALILNFSGENLLTFDKNNTYVKNSGGFAGATYAPLVAAPAVPEPASFQIGLASLPIVGLWLWKKRMIPASH